MVHVIEINMEKVNNFFKSLPQWNVKSETGYKPLTTFWTDFSIAERAAEFGENPIDAIRMTFTAIIDSCRKNYKFMTELSMVLNHKIWEHNALKKAAKDKGDEKAYKVHEILESEYNGAWMAVDNWCAEHLKGDALRYYYDITD